MESRYSIRSSAFQVAAVVAACLLFAAIVVLVLTHQPELFGGLVGNNTPGEGTGELTKFKDAIDKVKPVANATLGSASGLGLAGGGVATALGHPAGMQILTKSAAAGGFVLLGNGFVA